MARNVDLLNKSLDAIRANKGMYSFSICHHANEIKLSDDGETVNITVSLPATQIGCKDARELDANHGLYDNLEMLPIVVFVDPKELIGN